MRRPHAMALEPDLAEAHVSMATVLGWCDWKFAESIAMYKRALRLDPKFPLRYAWYGVTLSAVGRFKDAIATIARALEHDPLSPFIYTRLGWSHVLAGRFAESLSFFTGPMN